MFKALTAKRQSEGDSFNDVLRRELKLPAEASNMKAKGEASKPWVSKGVTFPEGTEFRATYKGALYTAAVSAGRLVVSGIGGSSSLSHAARLVTNTAVDGWAFWEAKRPADAGWLSAKSLRPALKWI